MQRTKTVQKDGELSRLLESIFEHVTDAIVIVGKEGQVIAANPAAERLTGYRIEEMMNSFFCEICRGMATSCTEATCEDCFAKTIRMPSFEMKIKTKEGTELPIAASSTRLPQGVLVVVLRDMSEQYRAERQRFQLMMTNYVIQAQEEERKRVSRELHDGIGQALYSILVGLKVLNQLPLNKSMSEHLHDVQQLTARALEEVKSMAVELRPSTLDDLGLIPAIRSYMKRYEQTFGIETELESNSHKHRYSSTVETALYRICQEAMTNAAKYADTDKISIRFSHYPHRVELVIRDYGQGFNPDQVTVQGTGLGLYGMKERANLLGGELEIFSVIGEGTTIRANIPLDEKGAPLHADSSFNC